MGPGLLVTAAFIGPGTVTTATLAGASFGLSLLWAVVFSTIATIVLQEMSARVGLVARMNPAEGLRATVAHPALRGLAIALVVAAIGAGNAAFQVGNITGASIALEAAGGLARREWVIIIGCFVAALLLTGTYRRIERLLIALVVIMSVAFIMTMILTRPSLAAVAAGICPQIPAESTLTILALIGTTVVPYNLFLHASAVRDKWSPDAPVAESLSAVRFDSAVAITLGGLVTASIVITAAAAFTRGTPITSASQMADQLAPVLGSSARYLFLAGLFAAGFTSAITAPLAAAYATAGALGWPHDLRDTRFRAVWLAVLIAGTTLAAIGKNPIQAIRAAQALNGLLLPMVAAFLIYVMNQPRILGRQTNGPLANLLGGAIVLITAALGAWQIARATGLLR